MRLCAVGALAVLLLQSVPSSSTLVAIPEMHISFEIPLDWSYERNMTSDIGVYDIMMGAEAQLPEDSGLYPPGAAMIILNWTDDATYAELCDKAKKLIEASEDIQGFDVILSPLNFTVDEEKAIKFAFHVDILGSEIAFLYVLVVSDEWRLMYEFGFLDELSDYSSHIATFDGIIGSVEIDKIDSSGSGFPLLQLLGMAAAVSVSFAVILLMLRRRKASPHNLILSAQPSDHEASPAEPYSPPESR